MKRIFILLIIIYSLTYSLEAQVYLNGLGEAFRFRKITEGTYAPNNLKMADIQGSPFLNDEFSSGKLVASDGSIFTDILLRYNGYSDDLEFQKGKESYNIDPKSKVRRAEFDGKVFGCYQFDEFGKVNDGFFEVLTEGKAILLIKYSIRFLDKEQPKAFADPKPARFDTPSKTYFVKVGDAKAKQITSKKSLLEMMDDHKDLMETYISKNKLSVRSDDGLTQIVSHYNTL